MKSVSMRGILSYAKQRLVVDHRIPVNFLPGCVGATSDILRGEDEIEVPEWHVGDWWIYTFTTPDFFDDSARLVVATVDEEEGGPRTC